MSDVGKRITDRAEDAISAAIGAEMAPLLIAAGLDARAAELLIWRPTAADTWWLVRLGTPERLDAQVSADLSEQEAAAFIRHLADAFNGSEPERDDDYDDMSTLTTTATIGGIHCRVWGVVERRREVTA